MYFCARHFQEKIIMNNVGIIQENVSDNNNNINIQANEQANRNVTPDEE